MAVVQLAHVEALLAQVVYGDATPSGNALPCQTNRAVHHLVDDAKAARTQCFDRDEPRIKPLGIGDINQGLVSNEVQPTKRLALRIITARTENSQMTPPIKKLTH